MNTISSPAGDDPDDVDQHNSELSGFDSDGGAIGRPVGDMLNLERPSDPEELWPETVAVLRERGLEVSQRVGSGQYGTVFKATLQGTGNHRAIKVMKHTGGAPDDDLLHMYQREHDVLTHTQFPKNIGPQCYDLVQPPNAQPFLILEFIAGQTLTDWVEANQKTADAEERWLICEAIWKAYNQLHAVHMAHRDPNGGNIMISPTRSGHRVIRLLDFGSSGLAVRGFRDMTLTHVPMTLAYASRAVQRGERKSSIADEVHAVAKICFYVLTGLSPATTDDSGKVVGRPMSELVSLLKQHRIPRAWIQIMEPAFAEPSEQLATMTQPIF